MPNVRLPLLAVTLRSPLVDRLVKLSEPAWPSTMPPVPELALSELTAKPKGVALLPMLLLVP